MIRRTRFADMALFGSENHADKRSSAKAGMKAQAVLIRFAVNRSLKTLTALTALSISFVARWASAQDANASIEQSRLLRETPAAINNNVNADGTPLPAPEESSTPDDSFGAQMILKNQERVRLFILTGDASIFYTNNATLSPDHTIDDGFAVVNAGVGWLPNLGNNLQAQISLRTSVLRYFETSSLDFASLGAGAALSWSPPFLAGANLFARYDFTELLNDDSDEILNDHEWTLGAQRGFALGRSQAIVAGIAGSARISDPHAAQRDQLSVFVGYQLQITRALATDISYRFGYYFYNSDGRVDRNHVISWNVRYRLNESVDLGLFASFAANRSNNASFEYNVVNPGGGIGFNVRF